MKYNKKNEIFDWWGDNKQTAYKYLEAVSRKYVTIFRCASFYLDREEDVKRQIDNFTSKEKNVNSSRSF